MPKVKMSVNEMSVDELTQNLLILHKPVNSQQTGGFFHSYLKRQEVGQTFWQNKRRTFERLEGSVTRLGELGQFFS
jgi:hypothetical protein